MNEKTSLKMTLISTCVSLVVIAVLLTFSVTTFCWFAANTSASASGMRVSVEAPDLAGATLEIYPVTTINGSEYTFDPSVIATEIPCSDQSNIIVSEYEKAVVLKFSFNTSSARALTLICKTPQTSYEINDTTAFANYLSNVVQFRRGTVSGNVLTAEESFSTFFTSYATSAKTGRVSFSVQTTTGEQNVYLLMEYNDDLMGMIFGYLLGNEHSSDPTTYADDLHFILSE